MKCPKCDYLGFDTGDRCRNCGYDFSLVPTPSAEDGPPLDLDLHTYQADPPDYAEWKERVDRSLHEPAERADEPTLVSPLPEPARTEALPLFRAASQEDDDEPLLRFPTAPRPPLAVRRTPEAPKLRPAPRSVRRSASDADDPGLLFGDDLAAANTPRRDVTRQLRAMMPPPAPRLSGFGRRITAAIIDHAILLGIDLAVVYFTLRMAALSTNDWALLPPAPLLAFLLLVKLAYFCAFTAVGGQTIGKMAVGIRVVADDDGWIDGPRAARRTVVGALSALIGGLGFLPALVGPDRRALHDRVARTRVVLLRSA